MERQARGIAFFDRQERTYKSMSGSIPRAGKMESEV